MSKVKSIIDGANESYFRGRIEGEKIPGALQDRILGTYVTEDNKEELYTNTFTNRNMFPADEKFDEATLIELGEVVSAELKKIQDQKQNAKGLTV